MKVDHKTSLKKTNSREPISSYEFSPHFIKNLPLLNDLNSKTKLLSKDPLHPHFHV